MVKRLTICCVIWLRFVVSAPAEDLSFSVIAWNLQSGDSRGSHLGAQCAAKGLIDIWGFSEVEDETVLDAIEEAVEEATGVEYESIISRNLGGDKLGILFNAERFTKLSHRDENSIQVGNRWLRPALVAEFQGIGTGQRFLFIVNHLKANERGDNSDALNTRLEQCRRLNDLGRATTLPAICLGDFNLLYRIDPAPGDSVCYDEITRDNVFQWVKPRELFPTEDTRGSRVIFDFVFVANPIAGWDAESTILERDGNVPARTAAFPLLSNNRTDDRNNSDHRPVKAVFTFTLDSREEAVEELRSRIAAMHEMLREMEEQLQALEAIGDTN